MSTIMEPKLRTEKREKSSKKRKAAESPEDSTEISASAEPLLSPPPSGRKSKKKPSKDQSTTNASDGPPSKRRKSSILAEIEVDVTAPTPPTKRALRLLKKGKVAPPLKPDNRPDTESESENDKQEDGTAISKTKPNKVKQEVEKRSEHGIWIGNLPWSCDKAALRNFFTTFSDIKDEDITRVHLPSPADSQPANSGPLGPRKQNNKGFAYVDFASAVHVAQALELSEELLTGRRVLIKDQKSFAGRPEKTKEEKRADGKPPNRRVFLGNLRYDATVESLTEHFEKCGVVENVFVATFEDSGKCKGYAWITFAELEAAEKAVRGFVMVPEKEEDDDEESNEDDNAGSDPESEDDEVAKKTKKTKKLKMRKVWVNQIFGRPVRREFAEDAQVRYKKRYGKDGTKSTSANEVSPAGRETGEAGHVKSKASKESNDNGDPAGAVPKAKPAEYYRNAYAPRLTGGVVPSTGKKVVF